MSNEAVRAVVSNGNINGQKNYDGRKPRQTGGAMHGQRHLLRMDHAHTIPTFIRRECPLLQFDKAPKKATNLSLNAKVLEMARELGMNISQTVDTLLAEEVKRRYWEQWNERNKDAIDAYNARIAKHGLPLARYRSFGKSLGDGREKI